MEGSSRSYQQSASSSILQKEWVQGPKDYKELLQTSEGNQIS